MNNSNAKLMNEQANHRLRVDPPSFPLLTTGRASTPQNALERSLQWTQKSGSPLPKRLSQLHELARVAIPQRKSAE